MTETMRGLASRRGLDAFPLPEGATLYAEPLALLHDPAAPTALSEGGAAPLAGGRFAFIAVRLWSRVPGAPPATVQTTLPAFVAWAKARGAAGDPRPATLLARLSAERPPFAGLSIAGTRARPRLMGVLNVTPDSFSDGGRFADASRPPS